MFSPHFLCASPLPADDALLQDIEPIKAGTKIMMLGTREEDIFVDQKIEEDNIVNDLDVPLQGSLEVHQRYGGCGAGKGERWRVHTKRTFGHAAGKPSTSFSVRSRPGWRTFAKSSFAFRTTS